MPDTPRTGSDTRMCKRSITDTHKCYTVGGLREVRSALLEPWFPPGIGGGPTLLHRVLGGLSKALCERCLAQCLAQRQAKLNISSV